MIIKEGYRDEYNQMTDEEAVVEFKKLLKTAAQAFIKMTDLWDDHYDVIASVADDKYPFHLSFDEIAGLVFDWYDNIDDLSKSYNINELGKFYKDIYK